MKKTFYALFMMLAAFTTSADAQKAKIVSGTVLDSEKTEWILPEGVEYSMKDFGTRKSLTPIRTAKAAANAEKVTLKIKVKGDQHLFGGSIFNKDEYKQFDFNGKECTIRIPKGVYDAYVEFGDISDCYVFKENINLTQDTEIEFDQSESTIPVVFHYFDENNKELFMDIYNGSTLDTPGTADMMREFGSIIHKDYGTAMIIISHGYMQKSAPEFLYINKVSDKYFLGKSTCLRVGSHYYVYKSVVSDFNQNVCNSDPSNLYKLETDFTASPAMKDKDDEHFPGMEMTFLNEGCMMACLRTSCNGSPEDNGKVITYIDCSETTEAEDCRMNTIVRPVMADGYDPNLTSSKYSFIVGPSAIGNAQEGVKYLVSGCDIDFGFNVPVGESDSRLYPGHPEFSFVPTDGKAHFGSSVPVTAFGLMNIDGYGYERFRYIGRYGEYRETDVRVAEHEEHDVEGGSLITLTNNNIEVDGVAGKNVTEILYDFTNATDYTAPTFQMLTFKDADGNICDRLKSTQGAKMLVAGGDFTYVDLPVYPYIGYYTCDAPASVKAYYAPHGTDTWTELALVEDPAKFFMPAFGHFYEADLSGVKVDGNDAWLDLRLEMTDAVGNYQKQLISPAFKVNCTLASIDKVSDAADNSFVVVGKTVMLSGGDVADITVRSIDGRTMQSAYTNGVDLSGMGSGVYIVTAVTATGNVVSTKVAL